MLVTDNECFQIFRQSRVLLPRRSDRNCSLSSPCRSHDHRLDIYGSLETSGATIWHHDVVNQKLTIARRHRVLDMNEDSQRIVVVPVVQDTVHVVTASTPALLRVEEIMWDPSDLRIASRFLQNYSHIFQVHGGRSMKYFINNVSREKSISGIAKDRMPVQYHSTM